MKVPIQHLCRAILCSLSLSAGETPSIAVENLQLDKENEVVTFDVVALSAKPNHSWTATVTVPKKAPKFPDSPDLQQTIRWVSSGCVPTHMQSRPEIVSHCILSLAPGDLEAFPVSAKADITSVLFEDGTVEGDLEYLNQVSARRHAVFLTFDYWLTSFPQIRNTSSPVEQLKIFRRLLAAPDSAARPAWC